MSTRAVISVDMNSRRLTAVEKTRGDLAQWYTFFFCLFFAVHTICAFLQYNHYRKRGFFKIEGEIETSDIIADQMVFVEIQKCKFINLKM